jgi:radical SAM protein (TIGR01212 family)
MVELGLQTSNENTAHLINRGYPLPIYDRAVEELKKRGIHVITHVIFGLPGETREDMLATVSHVAKVGSHGIKIQLLHVLRDTPLETLWREGKCPTLDLEEYLDLVTDALTLLPPTMVVHRLTGDPPKRLLLAPLWSANKRAVLNALADHLRQHHILWGTHFIPQ